MAAEVTLASSAPRRTFAHFPWHLAGVVLAICALGIWNLASASRSAHAPVWIDQARFMGLGVLLAVGAMIFDYRSYRRVAWVVYAVVLGMLGAVFVVGRTIMGARRWLGVGSVNLGQPSELAKIAVIMALASWFAWDAERRKEPLGLLGIAVPLGLTLLPAVLILKQPDLGTALVVVSIGCTMLLFARVRWRTLAVLGGVALLGATFAYPHLKPYQKKRVETFLNPEGDALGAGYHAMQSKIAVGSGQALGKGWGQGTQSYLSFLPEQHTDFIFSVWAEERGFLGCLVLLLLYFALIAVAVDIAGSARDRFGFFLAIGVTAMLFWQTAVNIGMVTGILPVVGVTLPLFSYGGSSVLAILTGVGLLANVGMRRFFN
jgi:rod shape determining protein RodA